MAAIVIRDMPDRPGRWARNGAAMTAARTDTRLGAMYRRIARKRGKYGPAAMAYVAAAIMICAVGAALLQLTVQLRSFPAPIAVPGITLMAAALLNSLRRHLRTRVGHRSGPGHPDNLQR